MARGKAKAKIEEPAVMDSAEPVRRSSRRQKNETQEISDPDLKNKVTSKSTKGSKLLKGKPEVCGGKEKGSKKISVDKNMPKKSSLTTESADKLVSIEKFTRVRKPISIETSTELSISDLNVVKDSSNNLEPEIVKRPPKKRRLSGLKIAEELESPVKKVKLSAPAPSARNTKKSPKKRYTSIASSLSKTGIVGGNKNVPRKTLCNLDIIGLLDDELDEDQEVEEAPADKRTSKEDNEDDPEISFKDQSGVGSKGSKVPVWRTRNTNDESNVVGEDVFDPCNYGEEEFGPDKDNVVKKKVRKKKKDTKAILTWGKKKTEDVRTAVKLTHNLETPGRKKPKPKRTNKKIVSELAPLVLEDPPEAAPCDNTDMSHGAQNFFDSVGHPPAEDQQTSSHLQVPSSKVYRTPLIPKTISRFKDNSSTPNASVKSTMTATMSVKELVKNAFGFDSEEELSENDTTGMTISPVRGLGAQHGVMRNHSILPSNKQRESIFPIVAGANNPKPFRVNIQSRKARVEQNLFAQVKAMREKELTSSNLDKKQTRRVSPRKGGPRKGPILCSTLLEDVDVPRQRSVKEMFESSNKRQQKTVEESLSESEASSLYEDIEPHEEVSGAADNEEDEDTSTRVYDKENTDTNMDSPKKPLKALKPAVSRVYKKKSVIQSSVANFVSFDQSSSEVSPKKESKKDKKYKEWAKHQTSHFSEVEDFDLSFS